jgi:hypothetical protein
MAYSIIIGFGVRYKSRFWYTIQILLLVCDINLPFGIGYKNLDLYRMPKPRVISYDKS